MQNSKLVITPLAADFELSISDSPQTKDEKRYMSKVLYLSAVKNLMYAMVCICLDISHVISIVSRYMAKPGKLHWHAIE